MAMLFDVCKVNSTSSLGKIIWWSSHKILKLAKPKFRFGLFRCFAITPPFFLNLILFLIFLYLLLLLSYFKAKHEHVYALYTCTYYKSISMVIFWLTVCKKINLISSWEWNCVSTKHAKAICWHDGWMTCDFPFQQS